MKFIHFQPVFFDKICKKETGVTYKNHSWVASNMAAKLSFQITRSLMVATRLFIYSRDDVICQQGGDTLVLNNHRHLYFEHDDSCL